MLPPTSTPAATPAATPATPASSAASPLRFGSFVLDTANARLTRDGGVVELRPKSFALLDYLARRPGELVRKDSLLDEVWGRRFVSEGAVKTVLSELRAALGDDARAPRWIETVQRRGYRFIGEVRAVPPATVPSASLTSPTLPASPTPSTPASATARGNLPAHVPPPIAREAELAALTELLATQRWVTLAGTAGVGKTRLALSLALGLAATPHPDRADAVWWLALAPLGAETTDAATLRSTLAQCLQLAPGAAASDDALARALHPLACLLVVDNAEHVLDALAPLLAHLHAQAPRLRLLITSRETLQVPGEHVFRLAPLPVPAPADDDDAARLMAHGSVRLFVERVAARVTGFALTPQQQRAVAQVCRALDGLPLALELAAARVPVLGVHGLAEHLASDDADAGHRLQLLSHGTRTAAPHQRSLRAALDWSHALLTPAQQRVFRRLAVFRGGFTLEAAQAVCADAELDAWAALDALDALIEKSMLTPPVPTPVAAPRFTQLESLHAYAREHLVAAGELQAVCRRHLQAVCVYWQRADSSALIDPALAWVAQHGAEIDNLRAALRWATQPADRLEDAGVRDAALALLGHAALLWHRAGHAGEGLRWCNVLRVCADAHTDPRLRGGVDLALATLCCYSMAPAVADGLAAAVRAAAAFEQVHDDVRAYFAHYLAYMLMVRAQPTADRALPLARLRALVQPAWGELLQRYERSARAYEQRLHGDHDAYLAHSREDVALCRRLGAWWESWVAAHALMLAEHDRGRPEAALVVAAEMLAEVRAAGRLHQNGSRLGLWATMLAEQGDTVATRAALAEAVPVLAGAGNVGMLNLAMAWLAAHESRDADAAQVLGWYDGPQRPGSDFGPGTYNRRSMDALSRRLEARLGAAALAAQRAAGDTLGDAAALRLGLRELAASQG